MPLHDPAPNQSTPLVDTDLYAGDAALRDAVRAQLDALGAAAAGTAAAAAEALHELGREAGSAALQQHARLAHHHPPELHTHDAQGRRIDAVAFHPAYHALLQGAVRHGLHGAPWALGPGAHVWRAAGFVLFTQAEPATLCPVSMTYAATATLRGAPALARDWLPRLHTTDYDPTEAPVHAKRGVLLGMAMTERQGGSDVRANTTRAEADGHDDWGARWRLTGHKWFCSAPTSDAHLVLAQATGADGAGGLTCFLLPRWLPDGTRNEVAIDRLKDKLGNRANASGEVRFERAAAWQVGEVGRGVAQILAMGALTRLDCALGTAGLMRGATALALHHCSQRQAFGRALIDHPAMRNVLADLALESEAATALALRVARAVDATEHGLDPTGHEAALRRLLTPLAKFWICKRGALLAQEALECLGGNGYVEEGGANVMARIYREMPVNSVWEGSGNIQALDVLRLLTGPHAVRLREALAAQWAAARGRLAAFDATADALLHNLGGATDEGQARCLAQRLACVVQAALLAQQAPDWVFEAFVASRLAAGAPGAFGTLPPAVPCGDIVARAAPRA